MIPNLTSIFFRWVGSTTNFRNFLDLTGRVHVSHDLLHFFQVHIATVKPVPLVTVAPLPEVPRFFNKFHLSDLGGVSLGLFFFVNSDRYIFVGCGPLPRIPVANKGL